MFFFVFVLGYSQIIDLIFITFMANIYMKFNQNWSHSFCVILIKANKQNKIYITGIVVYMFGIKALLTFVVVG